MGNKNKKKKKGGSEKRGKRPASAFKQATKQAVGEGELIAGKIDASGKGFGFLLRDDGGEDLFIAARDMNSALGGDRVLCRIVGHARGAGEARVEQIVERANEAVVGTFMPQSDGTYLIIPDNARLGSEVFVKRNGAGAALPGQKVVAKLIDFPEGKRPEGEIIEVLGYPGDKGVDMLSILRAYNLYERFPSAVTEEAGRMPNEVTKEQIKGRKDYRDLLTVTIDGDDSRDFDDAVSLSRSKDGYYKLGVHIADVSEYVRAGTKLDKEALKRATSVYFPDRVLPMLPVKLSNGICSLNENEDRLALSVIIYFDNMGEPVKHKIVESVIKSKARMTYTNVAKILDGDKALREKYAFAVPMLEEMKVLAELLRSRRTARGNIEFDIPECKIIIDENGKTADVVKYEHLISHGIIEEFMLAANETVAKRYARDDFPFVFRAHMPPPPEKTERLVNFVSALGLTFKGNANAPQPLDFARFLASLDKSVAGVVNRVTLRSMSKATYEPVNHGHFGLAAPYYCHFTSPIRRYPDLMIHRIIKADLRGEGVKKFAGVVGEVAKISSERERAAESAERKADDLKKAEFMESKIGSVYTGVISGVTEWGIFVELDNTVEGLIRTENLPGSGYVFNADLFRLDSPSSSFKLGDTLTIKVAGVNGDRVSFLLAEEEKTE
ncbi:MAG: ribonuclease R [Clostridiales bacterium]|nr:ribonuclease R [Clostridiales bacterium]